VIDRTPQVDHLVTQLNVHLIRMPVSKAVHAANPLPANASGEYRTKPVPPEPHRIVTEDEAALKQQILDVSQALQEANVHQHHEPDYLK
jgi:hypothetical protein